MSHLIDFIAAEMGGAGAISFDRFMELALYCPECGYYEREGDKIGRGGDFCTSVAVGGLFGELLAARFAAWLKDAGHASEKLVLMEAGAHRGELAKDILAFLERREPELSRKVEYWILEPSARRRAWQAETLDRFQPRVRWLHDFPAQPLTGIVFSNELLDAMPVRRLGWDSRAQTWFEWGVTMAQDRFAFTRLPGPADLQPDLPAELARVLPDGFTVEISPRALSWWSRAARSLRQGWIITFDYGLDALEFFTPDRREGTLRSYFRHQLVTNVLAQPGEQDITAQVHFARVRQAGEGEGLATVFDSTQERFFMGILRDIEAGDIGFDPWDSRRIRQFQTLTHPDHFGRAFRVLAQRRS